MPEEPKKVGDVAEAKTDVEKQPEVQEKAADRVELAQVSSDRFVYDEKPDDEVAKAMVEFVNETAKKSIFYL